MQISSRVGSSAGDKYAEKVERRRKCECALIVWVCVTERVTVKVRPTERVCK